MIKRPNLFLFSLLIASLLCTSCEEEIILERDDFKSELVVNSLFTNDSPWSVHVSNSKYIFDPDTKVENITNARVEIYDQNGNYIYDFYHVSEWVYAQDDIAPYPKRSYSIKVSVPGYHTVTAKSFVPEKSTLLINNFSITANETQNDVEVDFEIEDKSKLESYYIWEIVSIGEDGGDGDENGQLSKTWIDDLTNYSDDLVKGSREVLEGTSFGDGTYKGTYNSTEGNRSLGIGIGNGGELLDDFSEQILNIAKLDPNINLPGDINLNDPLNENSEDEDDPDKVEVNYELRVMSISKELYYYYSSVEEYLQNNQGNHSNQTPYSIYTNVTHGHGIFAGFSESVIQF
ncbi:MAG: DUF4249 family protein [Saprospiraceae bacterium]|nr:DUF4249 family protein [Saprospiraceae bacterium]